MEGHLVGLREIDLLHDVNLAVVRPRLALRPESWPNGASEGHMRGVHEEDGADGIIFLRLHPYRIALI